MTAPVPMKKFPETLKNMGKYMYITCKTKSSVYVMGHSVGSTKYPMPRMGSVKIITGLLMIAQHQNYSELLGVEFFF